MNKKAQGSFEFILIIGVLFLMVLGTIGMIQARILTVLKDREDLLMESLGNIVRSEISLAEKAPGDYSRKFTLPYYVEGQNYSITSTSPTDIEVSNEDSHQIILLNTNVTGFLQKGENRIRKTADVIYINS